MINAIRRLLGYEDKFFDLLEASAAEAQNSVQLLGKLLRQSAAVPSLGDFAETRRKDKRITEEITEQLCKTFVTPLEREDIEALSVALYKIPKTIEKFSEKYTCCRPQLQNVGFAPQLAIIEQSTAAVGRMVGKLRKGMDIETMRDENVRLHLLEGEADKLILELVRDLYSGAHEPLKVIIMLDLYETLEKVIDRCRDAGHVIFQIVLKYS
jgi:uncharacterized protein Yka (UPF0111/DUF47 family)